MLGEKQANLTHLLPAITEHLDYCVSDGFMTPNLFSIALVGDIHKAPLHISIQGCKFLINEHSCCSAKCAWCATYWDLRLHLTAE